MRVCQHQADRLPVSCADRARLLARAYRQLPAVGVVVLAATLAVSALDPTPAQAWLLGLPSPGAVISGLLGGIGHVIGGTVGKVAVTAFGAIIHALFAPIAKFIDTQLLAWLLAVPDYARAGSHVVATEQTVLAMAGAALGAVATISIVRFWVAGLAGSGGSALEGWRVRPARRCCCRSGRGCFTRLLRSRTMPARACWVRGA
jgi:hypothetical protein